MAPVRQEPSNSPPTPPFSSDSLPSSSSTNFKPERGESTMNGQSAQRYAGATKPMSNHMRSTSISSLTSAKGSNASREQYDTLKSYLADHIAKEKQNGANTQRSNARDRLQNLSKTQFSELSTDVFDELSRRVLNDSNVQSLPPQEEFQPKRNQARHKLAFLPEPRFKDLASDIFFDLDRRYPELREPKVLGDFKRPPVPPIPNNDPPPPPERKDSAPAANGLANNTTTIVPTKSTITYEPVDYKIQTGIPSLPPTPHRSDSSSPRNKDSSAYDKNNPPVSNIPHSNTPPERSRAMNTMSAASNSSSYTNASTRSNPFPPRERRDTNQSDRAKPPLPRAPMPNGSASPVNGTSSVSSVSFKSLDSLMADLGNMITTKPNGSQPPSPVTDLPDSTGVDSRHFNGATSGYEDRERDRLDTVAKVKDDHKEEIAKLKEDYESRMAVLKKRIAQLESESEEKRSQNSDSHRVQELEDEIAEYKKLNQSQTLQISQLQERFDRLDDDYHKLDEDHRSQQQVVDDVQKETTSLLEEIKELSKRNDELIIEKDQVSERLRVLETESKSWQTKYEKTKTDLRNLKATSSFVREPPKIDVLNDNVLRPVADGAVEQARVIEYQASIDDLLRAGRSENPSSVLLAMKSIVLACKLITEDVENFESKPPADYTTNSREKLYSLKANFSTTLTYLMKATKAHATGMGISPVSLLDVAASHLTISVVDIVKFVGMRKSRLEDEDRRREDKYRRKDSISSIRSNGGYSGDRLGVSPNRSSISKRNSLSIGGAWSGREMGGNTNFNGRSEPDRGAEMQPSELKAYLERQTDIIIQAIQNLLATLRGPTPNVDVSPSLNTITSTVTNVISTSRATFTLPQSSPYRLKGDAVLRDLEASIQKLSECQENLKNGQDTKLAKSKLASVSFEIAKFTKELMGIL